MDSKPGVFRILLLAVIGFPVLLMAPHISLGVAQAQALNPDHPTCAVKLVFIHHSVGEGWLDPGNGQLLQALNANNYYVTDTNYGWGPADEDVGSDTIGDHTDIGYWYNWFLGPHRDTYLTALYANIHLTFGEANEVNSFSDPGGPITVVMFKSCFPNAGNITGSPNDPPRQSSALDPNPIWGEPVGGSYTVSNIKGLYRDLLQYFATRQDKLFILITTPPTYSGSIDPGAAANARAVHTWLVRHWLENYPYNNVAVFDYFNVLTSNGGDPAINDLGAATGNHHRLAQGQVQHLIGLNSNVSAYPQGTDSHPSTAGHLKATGEFPALLNVAYHAWKGTGGRPLFMGRGPKFSPGLMLLLQ
jgi:hypothetical protein